MTVRLPRRQDARRRAVPDRHRVLRLPGRGARRPPRLGRQAAHRRQRPADPLAPATSTAVGSLIAPLLDFAVVSVQMRGSGCSGGAFDLFDLPDHLRRLRRGRDRGRAERGSRAARSAWSASPSPASPSCSPPAPSRRTSRRSRRCRSPTTSTPAPATRAGSSTRASRSPGCRSGWTTPSPRPTAASPGRRELVKQGDKHCLANQKLRLQTQDALRAPEARTRSARRRCSPTARRAPWLKRDQVPVFLVGQFQDEQTGGHFAESLKYLNGNPNVWISLQNGVHADSLGPTTITRWAEFLKLYVANEIPVIPTRCCRSAARSTSTSPTPARRRWSSRASRA